MSLTNITNTVRTNLPQEQSDWVNHFLRSIDEPAELSERRKSASPVPVNDSHQTSSTVSTTLAPNNITVSSEPKPRWSSENFRLVSSGASLPLNTDEVNQVTVPPSPNIPFIAHQYPVAAAEELPSPSVQQPTPAAVSASSAPVSPEKTFFEKHNIMKWVIDDQDDGDIPGLGSSTVTSQIAVEDIKLEGTIEVKAPPSSSARYAVQGLII